MPRVLRCLILAGLALLASSQTGCNMVPRYHLQQAQYRARQLSDQNRALAAERNSLLAQNQNLQQQIAGLNGRDDTLQRRLDNLMAERNHLTGMRNPLSESASRQFADLEKKYPGFEFDPETGVCKLPNDIFFDTGRDELKGEAEQLLGEVARILNSGDAVQLNILIAGHTDDRPVKNASTKAKHPDNWYLSAHRSISVVHALEKQGIKPSRMGVTGYASYQPRVPQKTDDARRQNRRVEIFILAPGASTAGWDSGTMTK